MRKLTLSIGLFVLGSGFAMWVLLSELRSEFFRAYLPPAVFASYFTMASGALLLLVAIAQVPSSPPAMEAASAASLTGRIAIANTLVAAVFISPLFLPGLRFPILITLWPGIYMIIGYVAFLVVGVIGTMIWSLLFHSLSGIFLTKKIIKALLAIQLVLSQIGIYCLAISMFLGGYVGSTLVYQGVGPVVVGAAMEFSVIPAAISIFLVVAGTMFGVINVLISRKS